jgi:hypothetical protein
MSKTAFWGGPTMSSAKIFAVLAAMAFVAFITPTRADVLNFVSTPAQLAANDSFDWDTRGLGALPNGTNLSTVNGVGFTVSNSQNNLSVSNIADFVSSNGGTDDFLLAPIQLAQSIIITFNTPISGFGAAPEWGGFEVATYTISVFGPGNVLLGSTSTNSDSQGDPAFMGVLDSVAGIVSIQFANNGPTAPHSAALGDLSVLDPAAATPLPAALPLFASGLGALGLLGWRRKRKSRASLLGAA